MKAIKNVIDFFWPLLPEMDKPQEYPHASKGEIRTIGTDLQSICKAAEKCYDAEFDRMRVIEGKASMFIGTTTFMATFIIGISTFLAKGGTSSFLLITLAVLAFLVCMYMARVLYFAIRTLERSKIWVLNSLDFYKVASLDDYLKEATCQYINATNMNHSPINEKMNFVVAAQRYFKRVLITLGLYALVLLVYSIRHFDKASGTPIMEAVKMVDEFHPEPWLLIVLFFISATAIIMVVLSCLCTGGRGQRQ